MQGGTSTKNFDLDENSNPRFKGFIEQKLLLLRFWKYAQKLRNFANTRPTKKLKAFFALAESLPTFATLNQ